MKFNIGDFVKRKQTVPNLNKEYRIVATKSTVVVSLTLDGQKVATIDNYYELSELTDLLKTYWDKEENLILISKDKLLNSIGRQIQELTALKKLVEG